MANAGGGHYHNPSMASMMSQGQGTHARAQFPAYGAGGQYYGMGQQQQQQQQQQQPQLDYQFYGALRQQQQQQQQQQPPLGYGTPFQQQHSYSQPAGPVQPQPQPPPPPPPPPGEVLKRSGGANNVTAPQSVNSSLPPLMPPPLPPMFPWMSPALAESMTCSQFGKSFEEQASNLPFVPIIVNDSDLAKMTENLIKEAEQTKSHELKYYKEVISQDLPQALIDMFQPLYCKLCTLTLSSPVVAKDHYRGKRHKKAIEAWMLKYDTHSSSNAKTKTGASVKPSSGILRSSGNAGVTGPINGYITKQPNPSNRNGSAAPPPPLLSQQARILSGNSSGPQPLLPGLTGGQQDRKRPAAAPPPPSIKNTQQNNDEKLQGPNPNFTAKQPPPPPAVGKITDDNSKDNNMGGYANSNTKPQAQFGKPQQQSPSGPVWLKPSELSTNSAEFQQQPAKKPRWEGGGNVSGSTDSSPQQNPPQQKGSVAQGGGGVTPAAPPNPPSSQQNRNLGGTTNLPLASSTPAPPQQSRNPGGTTNLPSASPAAPQQNRGTGGAAVPPPPPQQKSNTNSQLAPPPPGAKGLCRICNVQLSSPVQAEQHFKGNKHAMRVAALKEEGVTDLPPPIMPPPPQPKPPQGSQVPDKIDNPVGGGPGPVSANNRPFGNQNQSQFNDFNDNPGPLRGGGGGPRHPPPNNFRNNNFNSNQRHNNNNKFNNNKNKNNWNSGPRYFK